MSHMIIVNQPDTPWHKSELECVNEDEKFWKHYFIVTLDYWGMIPIVVNADHARDALDAAVDHAEKMGWEGLFIDDEDLPEYEKFDDVTFAGNHGRPLVASEIYIQQIGVL